MLLNCRITGIAPLIMHNGQTADPSNKFARAIKEISSKRKKVEADYEEMSKLEWQAGLYLSNGAPCIPGVVLEAALIGRGGAARKEKKGKEAAASIFIMEDFTLDYEGPKDPVDLIKDERFVFKSLVKVQQARIVRTRPIFPEWAVNIRFEFNEDMLDEDEVRRWMEVVGAEVGLMDWRPKYGRFEVEW